MKSVNVYITKLSISDKPEAKIILGASLIPESIREGADVYFDCIIEAQPSVDKVEWKHNVSTYYSSITSRHLNTVSNMV